MPISKSTHLAVWNMTQGKCWYCGRETVMANCGPEEFCVDHVVPESKGGLDDLDNLVPCCRSCNSKKRSGSLDRLRYLMANEGGVIFSEEQINYLESFGIQIPNRDGYTFYFERMGLDIPSSEV